MGFGNPKAAAGSSSSSRGFGAVGKSVGGTSDTDYLRQLAEKSGLEAEAAEIGKKPKLSLLQRLSKGLGAFNPAEAILTGVEKGKKEGGLMGTLSGFGKYVTGVGKGIASAVTGTDYEGERRTFSDVAEELGVENKIAKFGIGLVGDILLDPSTYFGGALAKGLVKGTSMAAGKTLVGIGKVAPKTEAGIRLATEGIKDAAGRAFVHGYKATEGAREDILTFLSKKERARLGLATSNIERLGTGTLTKTQAEELSQRLIAGKRAEFEARDLAENVAKSAEWFTPFKNKLEKMIAGREDKIAKIGQELAELNQKGMRAAVRPTAGAVLPKVGPAALEVGTTRMGTKKILDLIPVTVGTRETKKFVDALITAPKAEVDRIKGLIGTREGWQKELFDELDDLRLDYDGIIRGESDTLRLADSIYSGKGQTAMREVLDGIADPVVKEALEKQIKRSQSFGADLELDNPYEVYFPFIKNDKVAKFVKETGGLKVGSEGYRKQFKNLLTNENLELNPAKAFFTREAQQVTDKMTRDFLSGFVKKYGKPVDAYANADDGIKEGFRLLKEKGMFGKDLGWVPEHDFNLIRDSISPEFQSIDMLAKATGYDAVTSLFKRSVTGLFAPFHVRNFVSGTLQNYETIGARAFDPRILSAAQKFAYQIGKGETKFPGLIKLGGKDVKADAVLKPFIDRFSGDTFYNNDFLMALDKGSKELSQAAPVFSKETLKETARTLGFGTGAIQFRAARAVGQFIEHQQKATVYLASLAEGKSVRQSLKLAEQAGFDYRSLTRFESQIMRRIMPFYSFTRKNIELQLKTLGENPQRIKNIIDTLENAQGEISQEEYDQLPDYAKEQFIFKTGEKVDGVPEIAVGFGTPIEQLSTMFGVAKGGRGGIADSIRRVAASFNPIIKVPLERAFNKEFFRDRPLDDVIEATEYEKAPDWVKSFLQAKEIETTDKNGAAKTKLNANPYRLQLLRALPTTRGVSYLSSLFSDTENTSKILSATTGLKPRPIDLETVQYFRDRDNRRELEDLLIRSGVLKRFEKTYIPKDAKKGFGSGGK